MLALRDNPIAISEGDATAPKIQTAAIEDLAVTNEKINDGAIGGSKFSSTSTGVESVTSTSGTAYKTITHIGPLTYHVSVSPSDSQTVLQVYINGAWRSFETTSGTGTVISTGTNVRILATKISINPTTSFYYIKYT
jgi:hypothetical protein